MEIKKRQYTKEQKEELVQALLSGQTALRLGREHNLIQTKKEDSSIVTGNYFTPSRKDAN